MYYFQSCFAITTDTPCDPQRVKPIALRRLAYWRSSQKEKEAPNQNLCGGFKIFLFFQVEYDGGFPINLELLSCQFWGRMFRSSPDHLAKTGLTNVTSPNRRESSQEPSRSRLTKPFRVSSNGGRHYCPPAPPPRTASLGYRGFLHLYGLN